MYSCKGAQSSYASQSGIHFVWQAQLFEAKQVWPFQGNLALNGSPNSTY
jgi:hypothetical protein